jgi:hypothetical protein
MTTAPVTAVKEAKRRRSLDLFARGINMEYPQFFKPGLVT